MMNFTPRVRHSRRQQGNTFIGVIIGLVIGLGIAVIVALAITKGTTPFTDKLGKTSKTSEPTPSQVSDPNQPMYGARGAVKAPTAETMPPPPPPDALQELLSNLQPAPTTPPASAAPNQTPTQAATAARSEIQDDKLVYYLQAGAFRNIEEAQSTRARLALLGFEATVTERSTDNGVLHRVRVGPFAEQSAMNRVRARMTENGIDVAVVRNQKPTQE
jgi:cell division protein FtsN